MRESLDMLRLWLETHWALRWAVTLLWLAAAVKLILRYCE